LSRTLKTMSPYGWVTMKRNEHSARQIAHAESYQVMV